MIDKLKKHITLAVLTIILLAGKSETVSAQYYGQEKNIKMGLVFNPNIGWLKYDNDFGSSPQFGFSYGLVADLGFATNYYFSTGLLINTLNSEMQANLRPNEPNDPTIPADREIRLKYAEVPLTIKLKSDPRAYGRFYGQFGFTAGVKLSGRENDVNETSSRSIDGDDMFRLGLQIGAGAEWSLGGNLGLLTGLSFNNGFTRAIKEPGAPKTSFAAINIGLLF